MYGFEAINHYNGWSMAIAGALIVVSGLSVLSFIISQFPRLIDLMDREKKKPAESPAPTPAEPAVTAPDRCPADINETAQMVREIAGDIGDEFYLAELYKICQEKDLPHPHLTIKCLREAGLLVSGEAGAFKWAA